MTVIAVIGLGYVGLPLVIEFGKRVRTIGFDISSAKVKSCRVDVDPSWELSEQQMTAAMLVEYSDGPTILREAEVVIVAVLTPVDHAHNPDFSPLIIASRTLSRNLKKGATVIYESTVYPGATEDVCIPVLESASGLKWKRDFFVGYSPERINSGDRQHMLTNIVKVVSGDTLCDVIYELHTYGVEVFVHAPWADPQWAMCEYGVRLNAWHELPAAVAYRQLTTRLIEDIKKKLIKGGCFIDLKACFDQPALSEAGFRAWRL